MKTSLFFISLTCVLAVSFAVKPVNKEHRSTCLKENPISDAVLADLRDAKFADHTDDVKCYVACLMKISGVLKDGAYNVNAALEFFPDDVQSVFKSVFDKCVAQVNDKGATEDCEIAKIMFQCFYDVEPSLLEAGDFF
uniref:Odorant binding protein 5 n=1 Tax=Sirex nitobei TaxID=1602346 RepID=A0A857NDE3_9HYME|nr:odorant binding protein 5 [Sirex nitobei]